MLGTQSLSSKQSITTARLSGKELRVLFCIWIDCNFSYFQIFFFNDKILNVTHLRIIKIKKSQKNNLRIALSRDGDDTAAGYESCVLLDHIPHSVDPNTNLYQISVFIPDVQCNTCSLQMLNPMTDKTGGAGCTFDPVCDAAGTCAAPSCSSVYHSCANVRINGKNPRNTFTCPPPPTVNDGWPFGGLTRNVYGSEAVAYTPGTGGWPVAPGLAATFTTPNGPCKGNLAPAPAPPSATPLPAGASAAPTATAAPTKPPPKAPDFQAVLSVSASNPPPAVGNPSGTGLALFWLDTATLQLTTLLTFSGVGNPTGVHIHSGAVNITGPVIVDFTNDLRGQSPLQSTLTITQAAANQLALGTAYVNIHTQSNPLGEVRGQVYPVTVTTSVGMSLTSDQAMIAQPSQGTGTVQVTMDPATSQLVYTVYHNLNSATGVTINGPAQAYTPSVAVKFQLASSVYAQGRSSPITGKTRPLTAAEEVEFRKGLYAVVVQTTQYPDGEIRAQIRAPTAVINADPLAAPTPTPAGPGLVTNGTSGTSATSGTKATVQKGGPAVIAAVIGWVVLACGAAALIFVMYRIKHPANPRNLSLEQRRKREEAADPYAQI
jgi:hypothetical protein